MKKLVPDSPRHTALFSIHPTLPAPDAIDEHCRLHAGEPRLNILVNAAHAADSAIALAEHTLARMHVGCAEGEQV